MAIRIRPAQLAAFEADRLQQLVLALDGDLQDLRVLPAPDFPLSGGEASTPAGIVESDGAVYGNEAEFLAANRAARRARIREAVDGARRHGMSSDGHLELYVEYALRIEGGGDAVDWQGELGECVADRNLLAAVRADAIDAEMTFGGSHGA